MHTTPPSLLARLRQTPQQDSWERFVELYTPLFFAWTRRLGLSGHDAADLVQDVFTILVEKLPLFEYDEAKSFRAWLKTILMNRWRNWRRKAAANHAQGDTALADVGKEDFAELEENEYRGHVVRRCLDLMQAEFQPVTWKACWEFVVHDRPATAVAAELGISVNAVYLAKSRVLRRLREELSGLL